MVRRLIVADYVKPLDGESKDLKHSTRKCRVAVQPGDIWSAKRFEAVKFEEGRFMNHFILEKPATLLECISVPP